MSSLEKQIEREHPEVLRLFSKWLMQDNERLRQENARLKKAEFEAAQLELDIKAQLTILRKIIFGQKSEQREADPQRPRDPERETLTLQAQSMVPPPLEEEAKALASQEVPHEMSPEDLLQAALAYQIPHPKAGDFEEIPGFYETSTEITVIERQYKELRHKRKKYRLKKEKQLEAGLEKEVIITAPGPVKLLPGCTYSLDFALQVVSDKYLYHLPLERQRRQMEEQGLKSIPCKTLYNLCLATATHLEPVVEGIRKDILHSNLAVGCDETPWPILQKNHDDGYLWSMSNQAGSYYRFEPTRSGKVIEEMLEGYQGQVLHDGFSGYDRLQKIAGIKVGNCWSHARRKFIEIEGDYPKECKEILDWMGQLFALEHEAPSAAILRKVRQEESKPLTEKIHAWLLEKKAQFLPESRFVKACNYALNFWDGLTAFLEDTRLPLSNNDTERALRHGVMGRKNFYGSKTINGADTAATLYTVIETCKKMQLQPRAYMHYVIEQNHHGKEALTPLAYAKKLRLPETEKN